MPTKPKTYLYLGGVFILSLSLSLWLPLEDTFKGMAYTPAIGALFAAVFQLLRDHAAYEKQLELLQKQQFFSLGITSHMAEVAFDKHVEFCEQYIAEVHKTILTFVREGPSEKGEKHGRNLVQIRIKHDTWITEDITNSLKHFEDAVFRVGSQTHLSKQTSRPEVAQKAYEKADKLWDEVLGDVLDKTKTPNENIAVESVKKKIRDILGIEKLTQLRGVLISKAMESMEKST
jgi:hypothetical protein